jgi:hypothetical protein
VTLERNRWSSRQWVVGSGEPLTSIDPATGNVNGHVRTAAASDNDDPVTAARRLFPREIGQGSRRTGGQTMKMVFVDPNND